jgi:two-component system NtrC family sensor kinase
MVIPEQIIRHQRRTFLLGAALVAACYLIDLVQPNVALNMAIRTLWVVAILAGAWLQRPEHPRGAYLGAHLAAEATGLAVLGIVALSGGTRSVFSGMLLATPFIVLVAIPAFPASAALTGAALLGGGAVLRVTEGQPATDVASWIVVSAVMSTLATYGTVAARRLWWRELQVERERTEALAGLADSERRRTESERLADVGRLAAGVAHQVNNPLAAVKSNVRWLGEGAGAAAGEAERREVVEDTLQAVARIGEIVADLRRAAHPSDAEPGRAVPFGPERRTLN